MLVTCLTKRLAEDLSTYYRDVGFRVKYLHSDIDSIERSAIIRDLRLGKFDVLVGINLLREGLDIPEVALVGILDADKEGFLRSHRSLIQTIGRAARNVEGRALLFADSVTDSMQQAIDETARRRGIQEAYNEEHGITPATIKKRISEGLAEIYERDYVTVEVEDASAVAELPDDPDKALAELREAMFAAAAEQRFEDAAELRDRVKELEDRLLAGDAEASAEGNSGKARSGGKKPARSGSGRGGGGRRPRGRS